MSRPPLAEALDLQPHPEGGWFRETYRCDITFMPTGHDGERAAATAIYYLLEAADSSAWHVVASDEIWLWHAGGPLELMLGGTSDEPSHALDRYVLGNDTASGEQPQVLVPKHTWQSARPAANADVLVSCIVVPGFDFADFRLHHLT